MVSIQVSVASSQHSSGGIARVPSSLASHAVSPEGHSVVVDVDEEDVVLDVVVEVVEVV